MVCYVHCDIVVLRLNGQVLRYLELVEEFGKLGLQVFEAGFGE